MIVMSSHLILPSIITAYRNSWALDARVGRWTLDTGLWTLDPGRFKDHGHACSVETIGSDVDIFRNSILTLSVSYKRMRKEIFIVGNRVTLQAAILDYSEAAVHSHPFSEISPKNTGGRVLILVKLQADCSEWQLYTKMTPLS